MIARVEERASTEGVLSLMHPVVSEWFRNKFGELTEAQALAVPVIHSRKNVLVSSPTGSGKTLTAFLSILNELILLSERGQLEDRIYAVYVSPLKALANDVNENLLKPLAEISALFVSKGLSPPGVKVAVRTGDTLPSERQRQAKAPPHIFITTPESLSLVLSTPVFRKKFEGTEYVVVDEVHEICDSKRGVALSVALERLQGFCARDFTRIGLSATVAPVEQVAEFLAGLEDGSPRDVSIVEVYSQRDLDLKVICPAKDMTALSFEVVNSKMYDMLKEMIDQHRTTLVFTNTRSGTESVVYKLKERGAERVGAHHGSLSRETRLDVESSLRGGELKSVVSSTSLELGIDIGSIDLVVQIGSPKSVAKGLQRIGRAGHQYKGTSKGRIVVFESDDLVECAVLCRAAHRKMIDRVTIPTNSTDVLAQVLVGLSIERPWTVKEALSLVRRSYCFRDIDEGAFKSVLRYLGGKDEFEGVYSKIWYDDATGRFGKKRGSRMIFYLNQGTIPEEADYEVYSERGSPVGSLSEKFVERLSQGDIFVLGGRSYEFINTKGTKAFVKSASGRKPTVPSWTGEMLPRSFDLSVLVARFRGEMQERLTALPDAKTKEWLIKEFDVDEGSATTIINYFREQMMLAKIPTDSTLLIEGYADQSGRRNAIFHFPFGRRVNDALSRAYARSLSKHLKCNVTVSTTDDSFMLTAPRGFELEKLGAMVDSSSLEGMLRSAVKDSELFAQRFRHVASRSFMVLRNYRGKELSVSRQQLRSRRLLDALHGMEDFPVMTETYAEILSEVMDLEHAKEVLESIERGHRRIEYLPFSSVPSPFAHNVVLVGVSDIVLMEDRSMLLRELHRKVLARVLGEEAVAEYQFDPEKVADHFRRKFPRIGSKQDILEALRKVGPMSLFREKSESTFAHSEMPFERLRGWAGELLREGRIRSVWVGEEMYVTAEDWPAYSCAHQRDAPRSNVEQGALAVLAGSPKSVAELADTMGLDRDFAREVVRKLETANSIYRSGLKGESYIYSAAQPHGLSRRECVRDAVARHVAYHAPITLEDLAYEVGVAETDAGDALRELIADEVVVSGRFVVGDQLQYMLSRDYLTLKSGKDEKVYDRESVRAYSEAKSFSRAPSVRAYFDKFGEAGMEYDVFQRVEGFDMAEFSSMRSKGELLLGRFVRGKLRYVLSEDAPRYLGVYRREGLNRYEAEVLRKLEAIESGTYQDLLEATGFPPESLRETFDSLDRKGHVLRLFDEAETWTSRNVYAACGIEPDLSDPFGPVVAKYLRGFGPVTVLQAASYLDVDPEDARKLLLRAGATSMRVGLERTEMFLMPDEVRQLDSFEPKGQRVRILSLYDPFLTDKWTEISSKYPEGWMFPIVHGSRVVGMVEEWLMAGALEVRDIILDQTDLIGLVVDAIDDAMRFYRGLNIDIVRVKGALGKDVSELPGEVLAAFTGRGYTNSNGMLVKGSVVTECYELPELLEAVFLEQNLEDSSMLKTVADAVDRYGGMMTDSEAAMRVRRQEPIRGPLSRGEVVWGHLIPDRVGVCSRRDASMYMAARQRKLTGDERLVLRIIKDQQPIKRSRLIDISPLGEGSTADALRGLYQSSFAYLDGTTSYVPTGKSRLSRENAWVKVIKRLFETRPIFTAEGLALLLGHETPMREVRRVLRVLEREGYLVKGHLLRGSSVIYWANKAALGRMGATRFAGKFVLAPGDNLSLYLRANFRDLMPETGRYAVFSGTKRVGSFKGRMEDGRLEITDVVGDAECHEIAERFASRLGAVEVRHESEMIPEWEIIDFYKKTHPGD